MSTRYTAEKEQHQKERTFQPEDLSEFKTRKIYIDVDLKLMGWKFTGPDADVQEEYRVEDMAGMPGQPGFCDYVLFGKDGLPLAVVEAKRTSKDPNIGRKQAVLYADCLERKFGRRPMMFTTNGFETYFWDDQPAPQRKVSGIFCKDDLQKLMNRRTERMDLMGVSIDDKITDRYYQKEAIRAVCEQITQGFRKHLLVMATGTGKTRTASSLTDVLSRGKWVTNILFLADRTALVKQAKDDFKNYLPDMSLCNLCSNKDDRNARIVFSTYPPILSAIDDTKSKGGWRLFTPAHFGLIIIDESHRSIFKKYRAIFEYFDAFMVGLTATPKTDVERNTYDFFEMEHGVPTYAYDYETAVQQDHVLVPYYNYEVKTRFLEEGISYDDLTEEDKERYEDDFIEDGQLPDFIPSAALNKFVFNETTEDIVLQDLMDRGIKVAGGDRLGKTILFAQNKRHAEYILERFNKLYPQYRGSFAQRVICDDAYAQTIIDDFKQPEKEPHIAVSVDMMDTGIDVPECGNLVFFKKVRAKAKFWQMIGRGTRLSKDIFDFGEDKKTFYIFDWCGNFEYFDENPRGNEALPQVTLSEKLFGLRVDIAFALQHVNYQSDEGAKKLHDEIKDILISQVGKLNTKHISVRQNIDVVDKFMKKENWIVLSATDVLDLKDKVAPLVIPEKDNETAKKFDAIMLYIQLSMLDSTINAGNYIRKVQNICISLQEKAAIPQVQVKMDLIKEISVPAFWNDITLNRLEYVRKEIRDLVQFIIDSESRDFILNIKDIIEEKSSVNIQPYRASYKQRVEEFLNQNAELPVLVKIRNIEQLNQKDIRELERILWTDLGTEDEYINYLQNCKMSFNRNVAAFIRSQIGIDRKAAMAKLSQFFSDNNFTSLQEEYLKTIITYVSDHGDISFETLVNEPPFDEFEWSDVFGQDFIGVKKYVEDLHDAIIVA